MSSPRLIVVGDGEVADPLMHVIDVLRYPSIVRTSDDLPTDLAADDHVVIVTGSVKITRELLRQAVQVGCAYIGLVGSGEQTARLLMALAETGLSRDALQRVAAPAGLELGAASPGEIAVAIAAELVTARRGKLPPRVLTDGRN